MPRPSRIDEVHEILEEYPGLSALSYSQRLNGMSQGNVSKYLGTLKRQGLARYEAIHGYGKGRITRWYPVEHTLDTTGFKSKIPPKPEPSESAPEVSFLTVMVVRVGTTDHFYRRADNAYLFSLSALTPPA